MVGSKIYLCIDLKSFYASVECLERGLDPLTTNLVVADLSRTEKTICLAVTPSLKSYGISGRARLFEVVQRVGEINFERKKHAPGRKLEGASADSVALANRPQLAVDYLVAPPRMAYYLEYSNRVYASYLKFISPQDIHIYSIDEVFMDITPYLETYQLSPRQLAKKLIQQVYQDTGVTATAGLGTNLYLAKIAMDIMAKKTPPDEDGVRIAELDETSYRTQLWDHQPITDFWRVGKGYARRLASKGIYTMGDIALCSVAEGGYYSEKLLYDLFGVNAELLIDHAWGWEPCQMADIKDYRPRSKMLTAGQVLHCPYSVEEARIVMGEMADRMALDLMSKGFLTNHVSITIGYDRESLNTAGYGGEISTDAYGRKIPKHGQGAEKLERHSHLSRIITEAALDIYDRVANPKLLVRRLNLNVSGLLTPQEIPQESYEQIDLFGLLDETEHQKEQEQQEERRQEAILRMQNKYGNNAILKGSSLLEGATAIQRNGQIGGHKA